LNRMSLGQSTFRTKRYIDMLRQTDAILKTGMADSQSRLLDTLFPLAKQEAAFAINKLTQSLPTGLNLNFTGPDPATLRAVVTSNPMQGKFLRKHFAELTSSTQAQVRSQINIGIAQGESIPKIVRRLKGTRAANFSNGILQTSRRNTTAIVRTAVSHTSNAAREAAYAANEDIVKGVQYVATLDTRTTDICISLDGQVFPVGEGERPPQHMQCRSTTTPVLKSWNELGIKLNEAPAGTRASMNGQVSAKTTYGSWLKTQPVSVQNEALGVARAKLFRAGMPVDKFVNNLGKSLTLEQLAALDS